MVDKSTAAILDNRKFIPFFIFVIIIGGTKLALSAVKEYSALLGISRGLVYSMAPISGVFIILAQIINIYEDVTGNVIEEGGVE